MSELTVLDVVRALAEATEHLFASHSCVDDEGRWRAALEVAKGMARWSRERPTRPGQYYRREVLGTYPAEGPRIVEVYGKDCGCYAYGQWGRGLTEEAAEWFGPLEPPA